ncbi:MAG: oligosaccharide flippase family protein [Cytophaga sp.]|nr:oligosaccharide flippase family protein [Undibacterium sp.]
MTPGRNLLAGLTNSIWSALIGLAVVPFYLKYLGIEAYGLIGFFATTQAVLSLLDMGMAPTINREVARCSALGNLREAGKLLHTLAVVYWCMAGAIALMIIALAPLITGYWLQSKQLLPQTISHAVMLMGLVIACRWPIGLYQGALIGAQRLTVSSGINIVMATIGSLGAVAVLAFISPTIEAFFIWQACMGFVYAITIRSSVWRIIGKQDHTKFDINKLKSVWRFTAGMSGIALSATIFTQLDKIILSKTLGLDEFGHYMLASIVAGSLYLLIMPFYQAISPRLTSLVIKGDKDELIYTYRFGTRMLATVLFPTAMVLAIFPMELVHLWTGNQTIALSVAPVISILVLGSALHGVMFFPYALQLAYGMTRLPLTINAILMVILIPVTFFLSLEYGAIGGAIAWLVLHILYVLFGTWLTHRQLLKGIGMMWFLNDVAVPLCLSMIVGLVGYYLIQDVGYSSSIKLMFGALMALVAVLLSLVSMPRVFKIDLLNKINLNNKNS